MKPDQIAIEDISDGTAYSRTALDFIGRRVTVYLSSHILSHLINNRVWTLDFYSR